MESAFEISAREIMDGSPDTVSTDMTVSQIKNQMEDEGVRAVPVIEDGSFKGVISYRDLIRFVQYNPEVTAPEKVMHTPPGFDLDDSLVDLADLRINSGRKMLVSTNEGRIEGVVGDRQFVENLHRIEELENVTTDMLGTGEVISAEEDEVLDRARNKMLDNNISRLPVVNDEGKMVGKLDSTDILRMMITREKQSSGGTSGNRHGTEEVNISGGNEKERLSKVTVDQLMSERYIEASEHLPVLDALEKMKDEGQDEIFFTEDRKPTCIFTLKDAVDRLAELASQQTILVQLTGVELQEEKEVIHSKLRNQLQGSLGRKLDRPRELKLHIKKSEKEGKKHRWELNMSLHSEFGVTIIEEEGWDLMDSLDEALEKLNRRIRDKHEKRKEHR